MSCCLVKTIEIPQCVSIIVMPTGLQDNLYTTTLTDKFGNKYSVDFDVKDGDISISLESYPIGLLSKYAGVFTFEIFDGCIKQSIIQCDTEYNEIAFKFVSIDTSGVSTDTNTFTVCCQE